MRDRLSLGFIVGIPSLQLILFGYAINLDVRHIPTAIVDQSQSALSRQLVGELAATQTFEPTRAPASEAEGAAAARLQRGGRGDRDPARSRPASRARARR